MQPEAPLHVVFCLVPKFLGATWRMFDFMLRGLREVEETLRKADVPFHLRFGKAADMVPQLCEELGATTVLCVCIRTSESRGAPSAQIWPNPANIRPNFVQSQPRHSRNHPICGRTEPEFGRFKLKFGRHRPKFGLWSQQAQVWSDPAQI